MKGLSGVPAQCWIPCVAAMLIFAGYVIALPLGRASGSTALRVCADPNNLPYSNAAEAGFENHIAAIIASEMGLELQYTWWPQRRGFLRHTLNAGKCDLVLGVPERFELAQTTQPYYSSTYVLLTRQDDHLDLGSLQDEVLRDLRIGVHVIGDDYASIPPVAVLAERGMARDLYGYSIYGDYSQPDPTRDLIDALVAGEIDVAIAWGPIAGYFSQQAAAPVEMIPLADANQRLPMRFAISMAVRKGNDVLHDHIESVLHARREDIQSVLRQYDVPMVASGAHPAPASRHSRTPNLQTTE